MAKKKKHSRKKSVYKEQKKSVAPASAVKKDPGKGSVQVLGGNPAPTKAAVGHGDGIDSAVTARARREVRHSLTLAGIILVGLVGLWCLFAYTTVGSQVYKLIRL